MALHHSLLESLKRKVTLNNLIFIKLGKKEGRADLNLMRERELKKNAAIKKGDNHFLHKKSVLLPGYGSLRQII